MNKTNLKNNLLFFLLCVSWIVFLGLYFYYLPMPREVVYNCTWSEISPDIPPKVKEECRKLRMEQIK